MKKKCNICDTIKSIDDFYKNQTRCKLCTKQYNLDNKNKIKEYKKSYRDENKEFISKNNKDYYLNNKERINKNNNLYYLNNKDYMKKVQKDYRDNNREELTLKNREYSKKYRESKSNDYLWLLTTSIRSSISKSIINNGFSKNSKTEEILGCSFEEFKIYLESKFEPWMTWDNRGLYNNSKLNYGWDIDHKIPLDSAKTEEDLIRLNHYSNLQPLCSYTNRHIKMYKLDFYKEAP